MVTFLGAEAQVPRKAAPPSKKAPFQATPLMERFGTVLQPQDSEGPILPIATRQAVHHWLVELGAEKEFAAVGLKRRSTMMLAGPPGCGKTTLAHHLSHRLGIPMLLIDMSQLISMFLGETGRNIGMLFRECEEQSRKFVLFLDEFDAIGGKRGGRMHSAGDKDANAIVVHLLQMIDRYDGIMIAATNRPEIIDPAIWRRFKIQLTLIEPGDDERFAIMKRYLAPLTIDDDFLEALTHRTHRATPALLRELMEGIKREFVLCGRLGGDFADIQSVMQRILVAVHPHDDLEPPYLWREGWLCDEATNALWPPKLSESKP